ncbi:hypothetical protein [Winogradskyella wichelsiae]|uniref:hypothetical protein n=1 Tax=Winogradskyella wichelsiae TaxID=2697007 RepID=UPI003EF68443
MLIIIFFSILLICSFFLLAEYAYVVFLNPNFVLKIHYVHLFSSSRDRVNNTNNGLKTNFVNDTFYIDDKIREAKMELKRSLNHLDFIIGIEESLVKLASKDCCNIKRLQEYLKLKKEIQLKIIELSELIAHYQANKIGVC